MQHSALHQLMVDGSTQQQHEKVLTQTTDCDLPPGLIAKSLREQKFSGWVQLAY
jgi:hypothetical protein